MPTRVNADDVAIGARRAAADAAARSRVVISTVEAVADLEQVIALFDGIWGTAGAPPIGLEHMRALAHGGNYVTTASDSQTGQVVGASVAFFAAPVGRTLHSDITGVAATARDRKLGFAIKVDQRAWALERGLDTVTWTYDPLVARNAHFNLAKLRARGVRYYQDFYGAMADGINRGQGSDRLVASWPLADPSVAAACEAVATTPPRLPQPANALALLADDTGLPRRLEPDPAASHVTVLVPSDIEAMRAADPEHALAWRVAVRETLGSELAAGATVLSFDRDTGYLIERARP